MYTDEDFFRRNPNRHTRLRPLLPGETALDSPKPPLRWFAASIRYGKCFRVEMRADARPELFDENSSECVIDLLRAFNEARRGL
jgi:hypothetical protein